MKRYTGYKSTKRSKFGVDISSAGKRRRTLDGVTFGSGWEVTRYGYLKIRLRAGEISDLELHPKFEIIPAFAHQGKHYRAASYAADFQYIDVATGKTVVEEVKGMESRDFTLRKKLFLIQNPDIVYKLLKTKKSLTED